MSKRFKLEVEGFATEEVKGESIEAWFKSIGQEVPERWKTGREYTKEEYAKLADYEELLSISKRYGELISTKKGMLRLIELIESEEVEVKSKAKKK